MNSSMALDILVYGILCRKLYALSFYIFMTLSIEVIDFSVLYKRRVTETFDGFILFIYPNGDFYIQ